ncbi:MAG TPA: proline racemase family protein [Steroidobacteraceae bacterium]|nr:proline racemase family protein [Steroidobacteraceae bacterium]
MRRLICVVGCHAAGEVGDVIVGGVLPPAGATMYDKMRTMERDHDHIRRMLLCEPRGSVARHVNLIVPATRPDCDAGVIIMEPTEYVPMSGSNTIASVTVLLETGMVPMKEPETLVTLDMPGGVVRARASCRGGKCESVELENVPCFAHRLDAPLDVDGVGRISVDIAYGGMFFAIADAASLEFEIRPDEARALAELGEKIRVAAREQLEVVHPENPGIRGVSIVQFAQPYQGPGKVTRNTCIVAPGRSDRSPTGTGTCARMAVLHARGQMKVGDTLIHSSIIGSEFHGRIERECSVGGKPAIVPTVRGSAWITGFHNYVLDGTDPFPQGYVVADTWGVSGKLTQ